MNNFSNNKNMIAILFRGDKTWDRKERCRTHGTDICIKTKAVR